jgi:hypothetical protein
MSRADAPAAVDRDWRFREERTYQIPESWADNGRHEVPEDVDERYYAVQVKLGVSLQWGVDDTGAIVDGPHRDKPTVRVCYVARDGCSAYVRDWDAVLDDGQATPERNFASVLAVDPDDADPVDDVDNQVWYRDVLQQRYDVTPIVADGGTSTSDTEQSRSFRLDQPSSFMTVAEDMSYLLDLAVSEAEYPMQVNISIEIGPPEPEKICEYEGCDHDAQTVVVFEELDSWHEFCAGHAGITVQQHDDARTLGGER